jgi:spermidine synthase
VGPLLVRLRATELARVGRAAGWVSAVSTAGSVAGALAAGFWLIPNFSVSVLLGVLGAGLGALAAYCLWSGRGGAKAAVLLLAASLFSGAWTAQRERPAGAAVRFHAKSFYGDLMVVDAESWGKRIFYIDGMPNTVVDLKTLESTSDYIRSFEFLPFMRPEGKKALLIGLGGGGLVERYRRYYGVETDAVEIDGKVVEVAKAWFAFQPSGKVLLEDGRRVLERAGEPYDFIVIDAFNGDQHPFHLFTCEAFKAAAKRLKGDGVFAMNVIGFALGPKADLRRSVERTLRETFPNVRVLAASTGHDPRTHTVNLTFFASKAPLDFRRDPAGGRPELAEYYANVRGSFIDGLDSPSDAARARLLTDDDNPVDALSAESGLYVRRTLLQQSAAWMAD